MRIISLVLRHSKKKLRTPIVKMLTRSVTMAKRKMDSGEEKQNQENKWRRLQLLASEKKLLDKFLEGCLHSPSRDDLNIINAVQGADESPHDEDDGALENDV